MISFKTHLASLESFIVNFNHLAEEMFLQGHNQNEPLYQIKDIQPLIGGEKFCVLDNNDVSIILDNYIDTINYLRALRDTKLTFYYI